VRVKGAKKAKAGDRLRGVGTGATEHDLVASVVPA
jgi:hypothetical protein